MTAAARAAAAAVLVGGGLYSEDARPREGGGSRGLVVGGCFASCEQVQGISANAFSVSELDFGFHRARRHRQRGHSSHRLWYHGHQRAVTRRIWVPIAFWIDIRTLIDSFLGWVCKRRCQMGCPSQKWIA